MNAWRSVWPDSVVDSGSAGDGSHDSGCAVPVESSAGAVSEDRAVAAFADGEIDGACGAWGERDGHGLAAFAMDHQGAVAAFEAELVDIRADCFRDP